jgi:LysR family glycine cleavage system transcriptional activator
MKRLAPLNALRAFEVAARTGSFANAAREMGISSAAVSQHVKQLEAYWGKTLFIRQGNRIALTDAGQAVYPQLGQSMGALAALSDTMRHAEHRRRLVLSVPHSIAETWLAPRLARGGPLDFAKALEIRVEDDPVDLARDRIDMRIFYGHDLYGDYRVVPLFLDVLIAVASKDFVTCHGTDIKQIADHFLIHTDWGRDFSTSPNWGGVSTLGRVVDPNVGLRVGASSTALSFARQGFGVALLPRRFADEDLTAGRVVQMEMAPIPMEQHYLMAYPKRLASNPILQSIVKLLADQPPATEETCPWSVTDTPASRS